MTAREAAKQIKSILDERHIKYAKISARTVSFTDLARAKRVFVTIEGWGPEPATAAELRSIAGSNGFSVEFGR